MAESKSVTLEGFAMVSKTDMLSKERRRASHGPPDVKLAPNNGGVA